MRQEWMTSQQAKMMFGLGFKVLSELAKSGKIEMRTVPSSDSDTYLFSVDGVRKYIEECGVCDGR